MQWKKPRKKRLEALEPIKDVVNWAEKLGSIYMLGNGLFRFYKPLSKFALRYAPSFYSGIESTVNNWFGKNSKINGN